MLLDVYVTKGIDASFVSAVMDSIMAGTAILAVLAARNYLAQFTAQEGYKEAIELMNDVMPLIGRNLNSIHITYGKIDVFLSGLIDTSCLYEDILDRQLTSLETSTDDLLENYVKLRTYLSNISTFGLVMDEGRYNNLKIAMKFIEQNDELFFHYMKKVKLYLKSLVESTDIYEEAIEGGLIYKGRKIAIVDKNKSDFIELSNITHKMVVGSNAALSAFNSTVSEPRNITKIFKV